MEQPILRLGLLGFPEGDGQRLLRWASRSAPGWPMWRASDPHLADAWMIFGPSVEVLGRDAVVIRHPHGSEERFTLNRAEVDRPLAFASPLPEGFASAEFFEASDEADVRQRLQRFEAWLRPLRTQFALGEQLVKRVPQFKAGVVHVMHENKLLAVLDFDNWMTGIHIPARPVDVDMSEWIRRPSLANDIPSSFIRMPLHRVMWTYAIRTVHDVLPARYRQMTIFLRRVPRLPPRWFDDLHLTLMRELMMKPATLDELCDRIHTAPEGLAHHVASLYFAGGVTTDPDSARRAETRVRKDMVALHLNESAPDGDRWSRSTMVGGAPASEHPAPSSILRDALHSPLRVVTGPRSGAGPTVPMPLSDDL
jgi:hypothetical protein